MTFQAWPKIPRFENESFYFTEKLDGTNACVAFHADGSYHVQSRSRIIAPGDDNFGFAGWVAANIDDLRKLGEGYHYGEWWGLGIQRGYGLGEKRFSLFNTQRWNDDNPNRPACCSVVPTIRAATLADARQQLIDNGSVAAPGWIKPEGIVMFSKQAQTLYKSIIDK